MLLLECLELYMTNAMPEQRRAPNVPATMPEVAAHVFFFFVMHTPAMIVVMR
jgi:hypothetical protein